MSCIYLRCRKCRAHLNEECGECVVSLHGEPIKTSDTKVDEPCSQVLNNVFYMKDSCMPKWIMESVNKADWRRGKLSCPQCSARLGSFDFVSGSKCSCNNYVLPPVHLVKSKVDYNVI